MKPLARLFPCSLSALALTFPALAQQSQPAASMPADVFEYLEIDAGALDRGLHQLDLVQLLEDPEFSEFFLPLFEKIGADPNAPIDSLLAHVPIQQFLAGNAAVGIRGFRAWVEHPDGTSTRVEVSPNSPIDAQGILNLMGMGASAALDDELGATWDPKTLKYEIGLDLIAVLEPGPALQQMAQQFLSGPQGPITDIHIDDVAGRSVTHLSFDIEQTHGVITDIYADMSGDSWLITTSLDTFKSISAMGPGDSLAASPQFKKVFDRMTSGDPVLFGYQDAELQIGILQNFFPPILTQGLDILGLTSLQGSGMALSMTEGGVHESFGVVLDGDPDGIFNLLDAFPGGIEMASQAPSNALGLMAFKFDAKILFDSVVGLVGTILPGTESRVTAMAEAGVAQAGLNLQKDVLGVFGDEVSVVTFPPAGMMAPPDWLMSIDVRDEAAAGQLLGNIQAMVAQQGAPVTFRDMELDGGISAQMVQIEGAPILPVLAITNGRLLVASTKNILLQAATEWGSDGSPTMASNPVYQQTMRGLANGNTDNIAMLAYLDLRQIAPPVLMMTMGMMPSEFVDTVAAPEISDFADHLGGIAVAVRNDGDGITLDTFSPLGFIIPGLAVLGTQISGDHGPPIPMMQGGGGSAANQLNTEAWNMVRFANGDSSQFPAGLELSKAATGMEPENHWYLNTLGVAFYRNGDFQDAFNTFIKCQAINLSSSNQYDAASDVLFLAMSAWQLGLKEQAQTMLEQAGSLVGPGSDDEINTFYKEAHSLIGG